MDQTSIVISNFYLAFSPLFSSIFLTLLSNFQIHEFDLFSWSQFACIRQHSIDERSFSWASFVFPWHHKYLEHFVFFLLIIYLYMYLYWFLLRRFFRGRDCFSLVFFLLFCQKQTLRYDLIILTWLMVIYLRHETMSHTFDHIPTFLREWSHSTLPNNLASINSLK